MTTAQVNPRETFGTDGRGDPLDPWHLLLRISAVSTIAFSVAHQVLGRFFGISLAVLGVLLAIGLVLDLLGKGAARWWFLVVGVLFFVLHAFVMTLVAKHPEGAESFITVVGLTVGLAVILVAATMTGRQPHLARWVGIAAVAVWVAATGYSVPARLAIHDDAARAGEAVIELRDGMAALPVIAIPSRGTVVLHNADNSPLFVDAGRVGIHVYLPPHYRRRVRASAAMGSSSYTVDGPDARMKGTIIVS